MNALRASVLIAAYEHCDFLRRTLIGFSRQTVQDFEVIVCDDGSGPAVGNQVAQFENMFGGRISHVRHEKAGFRKCRILNEGISRSTSDYLVFTDADCIPHRRFVEEHLTAMETGVYLVGRRVQLGRKLTDRLTDGFIKGGRIESVFLTLIPAALRGEARHVEEGFLLPGWMRRMPGRSETRLKGCNFSCRKKDLEAINGFNEDFVTAGGGEDDDVERRLRLIGLAARSVKNAAICYHQYHPLVPRGEADAILCKTLEQERKSRCERGLNLHRSSGKDLS